MKKEYMRIKKQLMLLDIHLPLATPLYEFFNAGGKSGFMDCTDNCIFFLTIYKDHDSWDASNSIFSRNWRTVISIQF